MKRMRASARPRCLFNRYCKRRSETFFNMGPYAFACGGTRMCVVTQAERPRELSPMNVARV